MRRSFFIVLVVLPLLAAAVNGQKTGKAFPTSGYYSGIEMTSKESGDYGGVAVYLTQSADDTFALVTIAEGVLAKPVLVPVKVSGPDMRTVEFALPGNGGRKFKGTVTAAGLKLATGTGLSGAGALLKRSCRTPKTYSNITASKESGDYGGIEVHLTDSDGDWFALVTTAEGEVGAPRLVEAKVTGSKFDRIEFRLPDGNGGRKFTGTIADKAGTLTLIEAGSRLVLRAKCYQ